MQYNLFTDDLNNPLFQENLKRAAEYIDNLRTMAETSDFRRTELRFIESMSSVLSRKSGANASAVFSLISRFRTEYTLMDLTNLDKVDEIGKTLGLKSPPDALETLTEVIILYRLRYQGDEHFENILKLMSVRTSMDSITGSAYKTIVDRNQWLLTLMMATVTMNDNYRFVLTAMGLETAKITDS